MLSDEDYGVIAGNCFDNDRDVANTAHALGAERARKVKPLEWHTSAYSWALGELYIVRALANGTYSATYAGIYDIDGDYLTEREAKEACQKHCETFVLSMLEPV